MNRRQYVEILKGHKMFWKKMKEQLQIMEKKVGLKLDEIPIAKGRDRKDVTMIL